MFKLAAAVMGSVFLGLVFATISKGDPPAESPALNSNQVSIVEHLIDSSVKENIKPILDRLQDLERRTREIQAATSSGQEGRTSEIQSAASGDQEPPCTGTTRCPLESERAKGSPCWPSTCERAHNNWVCSGPPFCQDEQARHIDIHVYKPTYVHKHTYKHAYWRPAYYRPPPAYYRLSPAYYRPSPAYYRPSPAYYRPPPPYYSPPWDDCGW
jgi:hypothetical protein